MQKRTRPTRGSTVSTAHGPRAYFKSNETQKHTRPDATAVSGAARYCTSQEPRAPAKGRRSVRAIAMLPLQPLAAGEMHTRVVGALDLGGGGDERAGGEHGRGSP